MPRRRLIRQSEFPYHVYNRSRNKEWYQLDMQTMWKISQYSLKYALERYPVNLHAFVLMSNHYHMIVSTPNADIDKFMQIFGRMFSDRVRWKSDRINQIFGGRYQWTVVDRSNYHFNVIRYVFQNPLRAGHIVKCEDYPFSSLHPKSRNSFYKPLFNYWHPNYLKQINELPEKKEELFIRNGLTGMTFKVPKDRMRRRELLL